MDDEHNLYDLDVTIDDNKHNIRNLPTPKTTQNTPTNNKPTGRFNDVPIEILAIVIPRAK